MIELFARLFIRNSRHTDDPRVRTAYGTLCSAVAITLNILLAAAGVRVSLYGTILGLQALFYAAAVYGYLCSEKGKVPRWAFVPYYFLFMNANVIRGMFYLRRNKGKGTWEKARRG